MSSKKGAWGWVSTVLGVAALFSGQYYAIPLLLGAAAAGYAESKYQQRQAMRAYKKAFGAVGDNALAGSPTYSWDGPTTVTDPSLPVPICYGAVTVGGNIVNAWTETVNIYATEWVNIAPTHIETPWTNDENILRCDAGSRGIRVKVREPNSSEIIGGTSTAVHIYYRVYGASTWILVHKSKMTDGDPWYTVVNPDRNLIGRQYEIKLSSTRSLVDGTILYRQIQSAHENTSDKTNIAGHKDVQHLTVALSEGEIDDVDEGSVTLNDNKLTNFSDDFYDFDWVSGHNYQVPNPDYDNLVTENSLSYKAIYSDTSPFILTTQNIDLNSLILILSFPVGLYQVSDNAIAAWTVNLTVYYRKVGAGTWSEETKAISAKNNNPFKQAIKIAVAEGQYEIKVVKTSEDPDSVAKIGEVWWVGLQEYVSQSQHYPNTALAYIKLQATDQSSGSMPNLNFKIKGKVIDVPKLTIGGITVPYEDTHWNGANYVRSADDVVCTEVSGQFVQQWTRNPIWCVRDLINNDYYGLKSYFQSTLNDTDLRLLAKYCDELVDDGSGGGATEKRFQLDVVIDSQDDARNVLERLLSTFRGFAVWAENQFKIKINKPENPVQMFTMGNIIADSLSINYSSASDRFNVAKIVYPDTKDPQARLGEVMIYDVPTGGSERSQTFNFIGIVRRSQAVRLGRFLLNQSKYIKESIQFKAGLDSIACEAGDVIEFAHDVTQYGLASGRIKASTSTSVTMDTPVALDGGTTYKIKVRLADDTIEERTVNNNTSILPYTIVVTSSFTSVPPVDSIYALGESGIVTKPYRVLSISRDSIQERQITAIEDNAGIYSDSGDAVEVINYSRLKNPLEVPESVTNLTLKEVTVDPGDGTKINNIWVGWNPPNTLNNPDIKPTVGKLATGGSIPAGTYYCKYTWVGKGGETMASPVESIVTTGSTSRITVDVPSFPQHVTYARVFVSTTSGSEKFQASITSSGTVLTLTSISTSGLLIPQANSTQIDTTYDRAKIYSSDSGGAYWEYRGESRGNFTIENVEKLTYKVAVVSVSLYGIAQSISDAAQAEITIGGDSTIPSNVTFIDANYLTTDASTYLTNSPIASYSTINDDGNYIYGIKLRWNPITDSDLAGYEIRRQDTSWGVDNEYFLYRGMNTYLLYENPLVVNYVFYVKAYDRSGNYSTTAGAISLSNSTPSLSEIYTDFTGKDCKLWWQEVQDEDFKEYQVYVYADSGRTKLVRFERLSNPMYLYTYEFNTQDNGYPGLRTLYFTIKALDMVGQEGSKNVFAINNPPDAPTGVSIVEFFGWTYLTWNESIDPDLKGYYVYVDGVQTQFVSQPSYRHNGNEGTLYDYYVKATDTFGEGNQSLSIQGTPAGLNITPTGIADFSVNASKMFTKIPVLEADSWTNNSPSAGYVSWNAHQLYYNGAQYNIAAGNTNNKYIYWMGAGDVAYTVSNTNPTLTDSQFIIATNVDGFHDLAWNSIANEVIGSAYIQKAAINDAHIGTLTAGVIKSGTIYSQQITLAVTDGVGDTSIKAGKTDFGSTINGFILGIDDSDSNKAKLEIGDSNNWMKWTGASLDVKGIVTATSFKLNVSAWDTYVTRGSGSTSGAYWKSVASVELTTTLGGGVLIWGKVGKVNGDGTGYSLRIRRDSVTIDQSGDGTEIIPNLQPASCMDIDAPGVGTFTYTLQVYSTWPTASGGFSGASYVKLAAMEIG